MKIGFDVLPGIHPIVPIMMYDAKIAVEFANRMLKKEVYVIGFRILLYLRGGQELEFRYPQAKVKKIWILLCIALERLKKKWDCNDKMNYKEVIILMRTKHGNKVSIIGGAGAVGATIAYTLTLLSNINDLVLVDVARDKAVGEVLDLNHGSGFFSPMYIKAGDYKDTEDSDIVIITAGIAQKPNQTRIELLEKNVKVLQYIIPEVIKYSPNSILLIISNPVDILSYIAYKLSGFPKERVIGSGTVLDTSRLKYEIGKHFKVDPRNVDTYILGEHGDTSFPTWSLTDIKGIPISEYARLRGIQYNEEFKSAVYKNVREAAYQVICKKGATYYAIALSAMQIVDAVFKDMRNILPVSALVNDYHDASEIYIGIPCILGRNGIEDVLKVPLSEEEIRNLNKSAGVLKTIKNNLFNKNMVNEELSKQEDIANC